MGTKHGTAYNKNKITGEIYLGEFREGVREGKGRLVCGDGSVYNGEFVGDLPQGVGDMEYVNKDKYIGGFVQGVREGRAEYIYS